MDQPVEVTVRVFLVPKGQATERRSWIEMDKFIHQLQPLEKSVVARRGAQSSVIKKPGSMRPESSKEAALEITPQRLTDMVGTACRAPIATRLQPFVGRVSAPQEVFNALGSPRWRTALPFFQRHGVILPSEQPQRPGQNDTPDEVEQAEGANYCSCGWPYSLLVPRGTEEGMPFRLAVVCTDWSFDQVESDESCGSLSFWRPRPLSGQARHGVSVRPALRGADRGHGHGQRQHGLPGHHDPAETRYRRGMTSLRIELVWSAPGPRLDAARGALLAALREAGLPPYWDEWRADDPMRPRHLRQGYTRRGGAPVRASSSTSASPGRTPGDGIRPRTSPAP